MEGKMSYFAPETETLEIHLERMIAVSNLENPEQGDTFDW